MTTQPDDLHPFKRAWRLIAPYWRSEERWRGRGLLALIVALSLGQVFINVLLNDWNNDFYNTLQDKNLPGFLHQIQLFGAIAASYIVTAVYRQYLMQMLHIDWRRWLTTHVQQNWLANHAYYRLQVIDKNTDNPDQRIADDVDSFTGSTLSLSIDLMSSVVTLVSFVSILWTLSGALDFTLAGHDIHIPGYMVWVAIIYAAIGTLITHKIGRRLVGLNFEQQKLEANYRVALVRVRENAESIAFYGGEAAEAASLSERFRQIVGNWWQIMKKQKQLTWFTAGYSQVAIVFPIVVAAPRYFAGAIQLGGLMQTSSAFGQVQESLSWLINVYPSFASWKATLNRLDGFTQAIDPASAIDNHIARMTGSDNLAIDKLTLTTPDGTVLMQNIGLALKAGERLLLTGPSGSGKTTLLRAIAGLWPYGSGTVAIPSTARLLFVPQKAYLPIGTLRAALAYPALEATYDDAALAEILRQVGLPALTDALDTSDNWSQRLSPGEQQKLAFARILLQQPDILLLDEASAALDETTQQLLYAKLVDRLPNAAIISIGHRTSLAAFHNRQMDLGTAKMAG